MASILVNFRHRGTGLWAAIKPAPILDTWERDRVNATDYYPDQVESVAKWHGCRVEDLEAVRLEDDKC